MDHTWRNPELLRTTSFPCGIIKLKCAVPGFPLAGSVFFLNHLQPFHHKAAVMTFPNSLNMSGYSVHTFSSHDVFSPFPFPLPHMRVYDEYMFPIWEVPTARLRAGQSPAFIFTGRLWCPQVLKATGFHHSPFPKADFSPGVWARRNATCQNFVMHLMVPLSNPECSLHLSYVPVSSAPKKGSFSSPIHC